MAFLIKDSFETRLVRTDSKTDSTLYLAALPTDTFTDTGFNLQCDANTITAGNNYITWWAFG